MLLFDPLRDRFKVFSLWTTRECIFYVLCFFRHVFEFVVYVRVWFWARSDGFDPFVHLKIQEPLNLLLAMLFSFNMNFYLEYLSKFKCMYLYKHHLVG